MQAANYQIYELLLPKIQESILYWKYHLLSDNEAGN